MKYFFSYLIIVICTLSCMKDGGTTAPKTEPTLQPGEMVATGELIYSCSCLDGPGFIFGTDDHKTLVFDHPDSLMDMSVFVDSMTTKYKDFMNVHSRLIYKNTGVTRCSYGMTNGCVLVPVVEIVSFTKL